MDDENDDRGGLQPRLPTVADLVRLCRELNKANAKYIVIGGWAVIQHGFARTTSDIDILIDCSPDNFSKVREAMLTLPDGAIRDVTADDFDKYLVVRVGDEFVVDLMRSACGIEYKDSINEIEHFDLEDREKDRLDRAFLSGKLSSKN